jgi:hypothetical protein
MTTPDPERGLDPAHILAIVSAVTLGPARLLNAVARPGGVLTCMSSKQAAADVRAALTRVGYQVATAGTGRDLLVTGWSPGNLDMRLASMRAIIQQLTGHPALTARAVIGQLRDQSGVLQIHRADVRLLDQARTQVRTWVSDRSGVHAPYDPAIQPADVGCALRLRAVRELEETIDDLIERQLRVAGHALALFDSLSGQMSSDRAQDTAIRQAGITFHLSPSTAQDSSVLPRGTTQPPGQGVASAPDPAPRLRVVSGQVVIREFPAAATAASRAADPRPASPGGPQFPAARPGRQSPRP